MRKDIGKRLIALCMAALIFTTSPLDAMGTYGAVAAGENYAEEVQQAQDQQDMAVVVNTPDEETTDVNAMEDSSDQQKPEENVKDPETPDENGGSEETPETPDENGGSEETPETPDKNGGSEETPENPDENGEDVETPEKPDENGEDVETPENPDETTDGADQTEKLPEATEEALYKAEDLRFLVQTKEDFGDFDLTDGIEYDEEHYELSVKDDGGFDCDLVGDYVITYLLTAKDEDHENIEFTRSISIYPDEQYVHDGVAIYEKTGDMEVNLDESENEIATYAAESITVNGTGIYMNPLNITTSTWSTGTEVMYAGVNGYNRLVYCLWSMKRTPSGTNSYAGTFTGALQKKMNYVLYHGARYYGSTCFSNKYSMGSANADYYITSIAIHMLNAKAGNEPGYNLERYKFSGTKKEYYKKAKKLYDDANAHYKEYSANEMWNKDKVTITPSSQQTWTYDKKNNYYRVTGMFTPQFSDPEAYIGKTAVSCKNTSTKENLGKVRFENKDSITSPFWISLNEKNYNALQSTKEGSLKATIQYSSYKRRATRYLYSAGNSSSMQPLTMLQFDGDPVSQSVDVTVSVPKTPVHIYLDKREEGTNIKLSGGFSFDVYEWNKNSSSYRTKVGTLTWNGTYFTNQNFNLYITVINEGRFKIVETSTDGKHTGGWSKEVKATVNNPDIYQTPSNQPNPSVVQIHKTASNTGRALAGAQYCVYEDYACTKEVVRTSVTDTSGYATTSKFVRTQETYYVKEIQAPDGYRLSTEVKSVTVPAGGTASVEFQNDPMQYKLKVVKTCGETKKPLEGAVYGVYSSTSGNNLSLITKIGPTDKNGEAVSGLITYDPDLDRVFVKELVAPKYHVLPDPQMTLPYALDLAVSFTDKGIRATHYGVDDPEKTTVIVHKTDDTGKGLPGARFALYKNKNCAASDLVLELGPTDSAGKAESASFHVMQDVYYLKETQPPNGYPSQPDKVYEMTVKTGVTKGGIEYTVPNSNKIQVGVYKYELGSGKSKPLAGAEYTLYSDAACTKRVVKLGPTSTNGYASSAKFAYNDINQGIYYMKETKAPAGYKLSTEVKRIDVSNAVKDNIIPSVTYYNKPYEVNVEVLKVDKNTRKALAGATFDIYPMQGITYGSVAHGTTLEDGKVILSFHPTQETYWLVETEAPNGYYLNEDWVKGIKIQVSESNEGTKILQYTAENKERSDDFPVYVEKKDLDSGESLSFGEFDVCVENLITGEVEVVGHIKTDAAGKGHFDRVPLRDNVKYYLKETKVPINYSSPNKTYVGSVGSIFPFKPNPAPNQTHKVSITADNPSDNLKQHLYIKKIDKETGKGLKGAKFRIYKDEACTDFVFETGETDEYGVTSNFTLRQGTYYVDEIQYPDNGPWKKIKPVKIDASGRLDGTVYEYKVKNEHEEPSISIYKYDSATKQPLANAHFTIKGTGLPPYGETVVTGSDGYYRISPTENGWLYEQMIQRGAVIGETTYSIYESTAPEGYSGSTHTMTVTLNYGENKVEFPNDPHWYGISITKTDDSGSKKPIEGAVFGIYTNQECTEDSKLTTVITDATGKAATDKYYYPKLHDNQKVWIREEYVPDDYVLDTEPRPYTLVTNRWTQAAIEDPLVTRIPLEIYKYELKSDGTKKPLEGVKFYLNRTATVKITSESIDLGTTSATGYIKKQLPKDVTPGDYYLVEKVPNGYKNPENPRKITLVQGNSNHFDVANVTSNSNWYGLSVHKIDADSQKPLEGVVFDVYTDRACTKLIETLTATNADGRSYSKIYSDNSLSNVWVKERPNTVPYGYKVKSTPVNVKVNTKNAYTEVTIENAQIKKSVQIVKTDSYTTNPLKGAKFALYSDLECKTLIAEPQVTGDDGKITFSNIPVRYLTIYLKELEAPEGYELDSTPKEVTLTNDATMQIVKVTNSQEWTWIPIWKRSETSNVSGATFNVYRDIECTDQVTEAGEIKTNYWNGKGASKIFPRTQEIYYVKETGCGSLDSSYRWNIGRVFPVKTTALEDPGNPPSLDSTDCTLIRNTSKPISIQIRKLEEGTNKPIKGAIFVVYMDGGATVGLIGPTNENGEATAQISLPEGYTDYYLKEIYVPAPYKLSDGMTRAFLNTQPTVIYNGTEPSKIALTKTDAETGKGLEGAVFAAYLSEDDANNDNNQQFTIGPTASNGFAISEEFTAKASVYYVKEIKQPDGGYVLSDQVHPVTVAGGEVADVGTITNDKRKVSIPVYKIDGVSDTPLSGATFGVFLTEEDARSRRNQKFSIGSTGTDGKATSERFVPEQKTYYVIETIAPSGYVRSDVIQKVEIDDKQDPKKLTFKNYKNTTYIEVTKVSAQDSNKKLAGAVFEIYADASCTGTPIEKMEPTDENGYSKSGTLPVSANTTFYLKEVTAPTGYQIAPVQAVAVVVNQSNQTTVQDTPIPKRIKVEKIDSVTQAKLAGAQFTVYTDEACTTSLVASGKPLVLETGEDGTATSEEFIYEGTVCYLKETKAPEDYLLSNKIYELTLKPGENGQAQVSSLEAAIPNDRQTAQIMIKKTTEDGSTPLKDAVFGIYRDQTCENLWMELPATNIDGKSESPIFTPDQMNYYVKELYAPVGYQLSDKVDIVTITFDQKEYTVARTNDWKWTQIQVHKYDATNNNKNLSGAKFGVYKNINCEAGTELDTFETNFDGYGISKKLLLTQDEFYVKELQAPSGYVKLDTVWKVTAVKNAVCALLEVPNILEENKTDLVQVKVKKVESGTEKPLAGAYFTVYKDKDCTQPVVEVGPTNINGESVSEKFVKEQNKYWVKESKAPSGYVLNDEVKTIIPGTDRYMLQATVFENSKRKIQIRVHKTDAEDGEPLAGAYFKLYKSEQDALDEQKPFDEIGPTDETGLAEKFIDYEQDTYYLRESCKVTGYVKSDQVDELKIVGDTTDYYAENTPEYTMIGVRKVDGDNLDTGLAGAEFNVYSKASCTDESFVTTLGPTDETGYAYSGEIKLGSGKFWLKETKAPVGYPLYLEKIYGPVTAEVGATKETIKPFTVENYRVPISFAIEKRDVKTRKLLDGAEFALYADEDCEEEKILVFTPRAGEKGVFDSGEFGITQAIYYIKETKVPEGYQTPAAPTEVNIYDLLGQDATIPVVTVWNTPDDVKLIQVAVDKTDAVTGDNIAGAVFGVYSDKSCSDDTLLTTLPATDTSGFAMSDEFAYTQETYYLKEIGTPKWYHPSTAAIPFSVEYRKVLDADGNDTGETELHVSPQLITNDPEMTQIQVEKVEVLNGNLKKPLAGAYFKVYKTKENALNQQSEVCQIGPTKADGTAVSEKFHRTQETYYVRESQAPSGYVLSNAIREVKTEVDKIAQTEAFENEKATTNVQILKTAKDGRTPLKGAQFRLYATPECITPILTLPLTGDDGRATSEEFQITQEWYYLKESKAPEGYTLSTTVIPIKPQNGATLTVGPIRDGSITDEMIELHIIKKDKDDPNKTLAGAVYGIYLTDACKAGTEVGSIGPTGNDGKASSGKFVKAQDTYYLKELQAPEGYECSDEVIFVPGANGQGTAADPVVVLDTRKMSRIQLYKYDSATGSPLSNVTFTVYKDKACTEPFTSVSAASDGTMKTGEDGYAISEDFVAEQDIYYVKETNVPEAYPFQIPETVWEVSVTSGETAKLEVANGALAKIYIKKIAEEASEGGTQTPLSDAEFDIYKDAACTIKVGSVGPTDKNGTASSTSFTKEKSTYYLKETKAPEGYKLNPDPIEATVTDLPQATTGGATEDTSVAITPVWNTVTNAKLEGSITIKKRNADETPLSGAEFQLEVYDEASSTWNSSGIDNQTTGEDGNAKFEHLVPGKYRLTEVKAPAGYNLLNSSREITIPYELKVADVTEPSTGYTEVVGDKIYYYDVTLTFYNSLPFDVPSTGGTGGMAGVTAGMALMLGTSAAAWLLKRKKRKLRAG